MECIDINDIDNEMSYFIWRDFHDQYKPVINSLIKITNHHALMYITNKENQQIVIDYINNRLIGLKIYKMSLVGKEYAFFNIKRTLLYDQCNIKDMLKDMKEKINSIEEKVNKIYYAPPYMPGYIEALNDFNNLQCDIIEDMNVENVD